VRVFRANLGVIAQRERELRRLSISWDELFTDIDFRQLFEHGERTGMLDQLLPPIQSQEVWAAGVTYFRSRTARMEESKQAGGGDFYDRVYNADRPELFFKASPHRVVGDQQPIRIRSDSKWNVPEPELTLAVSVSGRIFGYTIGNDVSSRDIEGENPLYLPQAKCYVGSCALGPCILVSDEPPDPTTPIRMTIRRGDSIAFEGSTNVSQMRRRPVELVEWLFRGNAFPSGVFLMTGTGVIPPDDFSLRSGDRVEIEIPPIGTLVNQVA
jgi:2-dehydro-3-deoxy-D-arabinonate dehydratase